MNIALKLLGMILIHLSTFDVILRGGNVAWWDIRGIKLGILLILLMFTL